MGLGSKPGPVRTASLRHAVTHRRSKTHTHTDIDDDSYGGGFEGDDDSLHDDDGNANGAGQPLVEFPLISLLTLPLFTPSNESMERIDLSRMNRDNLIREIVQL